MISRFKEESETLPIDRLIQKIIDDTGLNQAMIDDDPVTGEARVENIDEFAAAATDFFHTNPDPTLDNFLAEITLYTDLDNYQETDDKLTLMTLHNAKGLEFDSVFVTGMEDGLFPLARSFDEPAELEEERRLLYVGATRSRKELTLTAARYRYRFGGTESVPSRFLKEIPPDLVEKIDRRSYRYEFGPTRDRTAKPSKPTRPDGVYYEYEEGEGMRPGNIVLHPKFGQGKVIKVEGMGEEMRLDIDFASVGPKKLIAKYAKLTVISQ
jgi:DNA helicase-2/ATP-dependent DNA helicase PcrA